jgi:hypothetical protein
MERHEKDIRFIPFNPDSSSFLIDQTFLKVPLPAAGFACPRRGDQSADQFAFMP